MHLIKSLALLSWLTGSVQAQCYSYAGVEMDSSYKACNGSAPVSMCCHLGYSNNGGDACGSGSTYGLCGVTGSQLWRESCTDKTWQSPVCLQLCVGANDTAITACADGSYCCGQNNAECCNAKEGKFIVNNQVSDTAAEDSASSQTSQTTSVSSTLISIPASELGSARTSATPLSTIQPSISISNRTSATPLSTIQPSISISTVYQPLPTSTSSTTNSSTSTSTSTSSTLTTSAKAGIGAGAGALVLILALALYFQKRKSTASKATELPTTNYQSSIVDLHRSPDHVYRAEVDGTISKPTELFGNGRRSEPAEMY